MIYTKLLLILLKPKSDDWQCMVWFVKVRKKPK